MTPFKDSTITQRAAFFRVVYGFGFIFLPLVFIGLGFRRDHIPQNIFMFPFWLLVPSSIVCLISNDGKPMILTPNYSNWQFSTGFLILGKSLFEPSQHSNKIAYRVFRGFLGVFTLALGLLMFLLMLPLVVLEMIFSQGNSVRQVGPYAKFKPNKSVG